MLSRVVVMDRAGGISEQIRRALAGQKLSVRRVASEEEALRAVGGDTRLLVLNPCDHPGTDFGSLERLVRQAGRIPFVILAGCAPIEAASRVLFPEAARVVRFPLASSELRARLLQAAGNGNGGPGGHGKLSGLGEIVGGADSMQEVYRLVLRAARSEATVLLEGETGSGKDLVARTIHDLSDRREGPFVVVSCADLTETLLESELFGHVRGSFTGANRDKMGLFEAARRGTVFLNDVSDATPAMQARLLRVMEDRQVRRVGCVRSRPLDIRLVAASQVDLEHRVVQGCFRRDLFYRLRVLHIPLPPLRDRSEDVPALVTRHLERLSRLDETPRVCSPLALEALQRYHWPGNVRELFAVLEAAATLKPVGAINGADLPREIANGWNHRRAVEYETDLIARALEAADGKRARAAEILGISRTTLWRRMRELGLP